MTQQFAKVLSILLFVHVLCNNAEAKRMRKSLLRKIVINQSDKLDFINGRVDLFGAVMASTSSVSANGSSSCIICGFKLVPTITECITSFGVSKETLTCIKDGALEEGLNTCLPCVCTIVRKINQKLGDLCCSLSGCGQSGDDKNLSILGLSVHEPMFAAAIEAHGTVCSKICSAPVDAICHYCISENVPNFSMLPKTSCIICGFKLVPIITECITSFGVSKETLTCIKDGALEEGLTTCLPCVCTIVKKINQKLGDLCCSLSGCGLEPSDENFSELGTAYTEDARSMTVTNRVHIQRKVNGTATFTGSGKLCTPESFTNLDFGALTRISISKVCLPLVELAATLSDGTICHSLKFPSIFPINTYVCADQNDLTDCYVTTNSNCTR